MLKGWHLVAVLFAGYLIGYYFRALGNATVAKLVPSSGA
jgi:hypothetical protein